MVIRFFLFPKFKQFLYLKVIEIVEISGFFFVLRTLKDLMFVLEMSENLLLRFLEVFKWTSERSCILNNQKWLKFLKCSPGNLKWKIGCEC